MAELVRHRERESGRRYEIEKRLVRRLAALLGEAPVSLVMENGSVLWSPAERPVGTIRIRDRKTLLRLCIRPELSFGDAYSEGNVEVEGDLPRVLEALFRSMARSSSDGFLSRWTERIMNRPRRNTLQGSRKHIHHHYDVGNEFYRLWLDERMQYTCAYFPEPGVTLEEAQVAKMDHVCRKLRLRPGERVVEAGCGWGTLALHMAALYGVKVTAYNISAEQIKSARARARAEGLDNRVEFLKNDYRNMRGTYDVFVSVGMLEHVGADRYRELGRVIGRSLAPGGRGLIHSIGRNRAKPMNRWIERRIFPGSYVPALSEMMEVFEPEGFSVLDVENLRLHYAKTLEHWLARFERSRAEAGARFDRTFLRAWRLYLAGSIAAFAAGDLQLFQVLFNRGLSNDVPWTRAHVYRDQAA